MDIGHPRHYSRFGITLLRAALGAYFLLHAYFIWTVYGTAGFSRFIASTGVPLPEFITWFTLLGHAIGGLMLLVGYFSRLGAFLNLIIMAGALVNVHLSQGFFLTGIVINAERGRAVAGGYEYVLFLAIACVSILFLGGGPLSLEGEGEALPDFLRLRP